MGELPDWWEWYYYSHIVYKGHKTMFELYTSEPLVWLYRAKAFHGAVENAMKQKGNRPS